MRIGNGNRNSMLPSTTGTCHQQVNTTLEKFAAYRADSVGLTVSQVKQLPAAVYPLGELARQCRDLGERLLFAEGNARVATVSACECQQPRDIHNSRSR